MFPAYDFGKTDKDLVPKDLCESVPPVVRGEALTSFAPTTVENLLADGCMFDNLCSLTAEISLPGEAGLDISG